MTARIITGDCRTALRELAPESVHCVVTSPPYYGLRDYNVDGQIGLEQSPEEYVAQLVEVFREVRRVLRNDGTVWLNLGDSYSSGGRSSYDNSLVSATSGLTNRAAGGQRFTPEWAKPKDLLGIPWRVAFALQADGWWLRSDIIWAKPNPMPESVTDRPTKAHEYIFLLSKPEAYEHEYIFLLSKSARYYYDNEAVKEANSEGSIERFGITEAGQSRKWVTDNNKRDGRTDGTKSNEGFRDHVPFGRNRRSVWTIAPAQFREAHFATFPPELPEVCILAGTSAHGVCPQCGAPWGRVLERETGDNEAYVRPKQTAGMASRTSTLSLSGDGSKEWAERGAKTQTLGFSPSCTCGREDVIPATVLDPFAGSGTTGAVAVNLGRNFVGVELNPEYVKLAERRIAQAQPALFGIEGRV